MGQVYPDVIAVPPIQRPFQASATPPGSKSITNRVLPLAALAAGESTLRGVLLAEDTQHMMTALRQLGFSLQLDAAAKTVRIRGESGKIPAANGALFCGNSGTTLRFLTAILAASPGRYQLDGVERMRQRPIAELVEAIGALGGEVRYLRQAGYPPVETAGRVWRGGSCRFTSAPSSQYISALLMAAPLAEAPVEVVLDGPITSEPYVTMTLAIMKRFGVAASVCCPGASAARRMVHVPAGRNYQPCDYTVEPDASNASYFLAAAAVIPGASVTVKGFGRDSLQGDVLFADVLRQMGVDLFMGTDEIRVRGPSELVGLNVNLNSLPDMVPTLAVLALFARGATHIADIRNLRLKESDRLAALQTELARMGARVDATADSLTVFPPEKPRAARIRTYDDHRMAMAFAVAGLRVAGLEIENPSCTAKTYPDFFADFTALTAGG